MQARSGPVIFRTVYEVEVFSVGPFATDPEESDLLAIDYAISEGDCIGSVSRTSSEPVPPDKVRDHLLRIGNEGDFFSLEDELDEDD